MKYKIYISGAIKNNPNYIMDFNKAKDHLEKLGFEVLSPLDTYAYKNNLPIKMCMFESLNLLRKADLVTFITEGIKSKGMSIEKELAEYCEIPIINYCLLDVVERVDFLGGLENEKNERNEGVEVSKEI